MADDFTGGYPIVDPSAAGATTQGLSTNLLSQASPTATQQVPVVFMGWQRDIPVGSGEQSPRGFGSQGTTTQLPRYANLNELLVSFESQDKKEFKRWRNLLAAAGYVDDEAGYLDVRDGFGRMLDDVMTLNDAGRMVAPKQYLKSIAQLNGYDPDDADSENFTGIKKLVKRQVTEVDEGEAWATIQESLQKMLGRDPSDQETRDFTYHMNQLAARNPTIATTVQRYKDGDVVAERNHVTPGFTADDVKKAAYDQAQNDPDYAEYTAATTLFNAVISALGPIGG